MIEPHIPITIREVGNGYIVEPPKFIDRATCTTVSDSETMVFADLNSLGLWLRSHFAEKGPP